VQHQLDWQSWYYDSSAVTKSSKPEVDLQCHVTYAGSLLTLSYNTIYDSVDNIP